MWLVEPWLHYIAPFVVVVITVVLLVASRRHVSVATASIGIVVCFLGVASLYFSRLEPELIGDLPKMGAVLVAMVLPLVMTTAAYVLAGRLRPLPRAAVASAAGILGVLAYPYVGLVLSCAFAGDCL